MQIDIVHCPCNRHDRLMDVEELIATGRGDGGREERAAVHDIMDPQDSKACSSMTLVSLVFYGTTCSGALLSPVPLLLWLPVVYARRVQHAPCWIDTHICVLGPEWPLHHTG
jgi:hypothetical protein